MGGVRCGHETKMRVSGGRRVVVRQAVSESSPIRNRKGDRRDYRARARSTAWPAAGGSVIAQGGRTQKFSSRCQVTSESIRNRKGDRRDYRAGARSTAWPAAGGSAIAQGGRTQKFSSRYQVTSESIPNSNSPIRNRKGDRRDYRAGARSTAWPAAGGSAIAQGGRTQKFSSRYQVTSESIPNPNSPIRNRKGDRRDSNPQQPESQSGTLPLSYGHHFEGRNLTRSFIACEAQTQFIRFSRAICQWRCGLRRTSFPGVGGPSPELYASGWSLTLPDKVTLVWRTR
jgi:hypothetical protein